MSLAPGPHPGEVDKRAFQHSLNISLHQDSVILVVSCPLPLQWLHKHLCA
jgi:hypothetical protein